MSIFAGDPTFVRIAGAVRTRRFDDFTDLLVHLEADDATPVLLRLSALGYGLIPRLTVVSSSDDARLLLKPPPSVAVPTGGREGPGSWVAVLPADAIEYCCRFLTEVSLGMARVDHVDVELAENLNLTIRARTPFEAVDPQEARRRLDES